MSGTGLMLAQENLENVGIIVQLKRPSLASPPVRQIQETERLMDGDVRWQRRFLTYCMRQYVCMYDGSAPGGGAVHVHSL